MPVRHWRSANGHGDVQKPASDFCFKALRWRSRFDSSASRNSRQRDCFAINSITRGSIVGPLDFEPTSDGTVIRNVLKFQSPFGVLGTIVDKLIMSAYLRRLLSERNLVIEQVVETRSKHGRCSRSVAFSNSGRAIMCFGWE